MSPSSRKGDSSKSPMTSTTTLSAATTTSYSDLFYLVGGFAVATCAKILLFPSYYSTDLLVHRHWKAVTRHLSVSQWYWDDLHTRTIHTLDYPPIFAAFESLLSNNPVTKYLLTHHIVDDRCLQLLSDADNAEHPPSTSCIAFLRSTVIVSDVLLWIGAWKLASSSVAAAATSATKGATSSAQKKWTVFWLIVLHPGLLWLDHVHFQYNGMLLGILLTSLSYLLRVPQHRPSNLLLSAFWFAVLINMKHLYVTLAPFYFFYLLRSYCYVEDENDEARNFQPRFRFQRLVQLGLLTVLTLAVPWLLLLGSTPEPIPLFQQVLSRLFPFQRGLVHDYWAANIWALLMAGGKIIKAVPQLTTLLPFFEWDENSVSPSAVAAVLLACLLLGGWQAWQAAALQSRSRLVLSFTLSALLSFQVGYHVHEKAIMTTLLPMLLVLVVPMSTRTGEEVAHQRQRIAMHNPYPLLLWEMTAWGLLGLFPLLYESRELALKLTSYVAYLSILYFVCFEWNATSFAAPSRWWIGLHFMGIAVTIGVLEVVPLQAWGRYEYAPLMLTSVLCASALVLATLRLAYHLLVTHVDS